MAVWFTSDTHYGDPRVLRIDRRPWPDLAAHDAALAEAHAATVGPGDEVWHLGDVAGPRSATEALARLAGLPGTKHLVVGNNDGPEVLSSPVWASVQAYREIRVDGHALVLCHYAFRTWNGMGKGALDLHGHSHGRLKPMTRQFDVGVDARGFRPVSLADLLASRPARRRRA
jgi:calcineurin-like phosphoesterase family protein